MRRRWRRPTPPKMALFLAADNQSINDNDLRFACWKTLLNRYVRMAPVQQPQRECF